jgi:hypothetical protein
VRTIEKYLLYEAVKAAFIHRKNPCVGELPEMVYDCPPSPVGYEIPDYITETLKQLGVKVRPIPYLLNPNWRKLPKPGSNPTWRMPDVVDINGDLFFCMRCHPKEE